MNRMEKKKLRNSFRPLHWVLMGCLMVSVHVNAQFGGFGFPPAMPGGMGMPGMPDMGGMFSQVKHTKVDEIKSNLPIVTITTDTVLNAQKKVTAHMQVENYDGAIGIKLRGNSSLGFNQKKYTLELRDETGKKQDVSLLGMPAHSDWVLLAPYNDISMMRDPLAFNLWREMGHWGPRTRMVELVMDGEYHGIYIFCEAIKRGEERVNLTKMTKTDIEGTDVTGGYLLRIDTFNDDDATFPSKVPGIGEGSPTSEIIWSCIYPKKKNLQPEQLAYIQSYVDSMELAIQSEDFKDKQKGYAHFIDVPSFVDYFIHTELSMNADGFKRSAYFFKERNSKMQAGPVWDYNLAYGNCNFANADNPEAWCFEGASNNATPALWQRLLQDPAFRKAVKTRYQALRKTILSTKHINDYIDQQAQLLSQAQERHFKEYPELLGSGNSGFSMVNMWAAYRVNSYEEEISILKKWFADRLAFLDKNIERFDQDWEPRIQEPVERKGGFQFPGSGGGFQFPGGGGGFPFPGGGFQFPGGNFPPIP